MTRKDYILIAAALRIIGDILPDEGGGTFHIGAQSCDAIRAALGKVKP